MLNTVFEMLISEPIRRNPLICTYAKNIVGTFLITLFAAPFYAVIYYILGFKEASYIVLLEGAIISVAVAFLKTGSIQWARQIIVGSLSICIACLSFTLGGIYTPAAFWLILPPLLAIFFGGFHSSIYWSCFCILLTVFLYKIGPNIVSSQLHQLVLLQVISISGLILIILTLANFFELGKKELILQMQEASFQLKSSRDKQENLTEITLANELLSNILESSIDYSIIATDLECNILTWNAGAQHNYGYTADEMIGKKNIKDLLPTDGMQSEHYDSFLRTVKARDKAENIFQRRRKNGEIFFALVDLSVRYDTNNNPIGFLLISRDITEKKRLEEQLSLNKDLDEKNRQIGESNRLKSAFLANMSHELRTPLTAILGYSELMQAEDLGPVSSEQNIALTDIITSGKDLLRLIDALLDLSKIELSKLKFNPEWIDLTALVNSVIGILHPLFKKKKINYKIEITPSIANVFNDPYRLRQVLFNYLSNAIKFTPVEGEVTIKIKDENTLMFRIEVKDNGIGIAAKDVHKLFVEFQQLDSSDSKKYPGTGLGLALIKHIVEAQGGAVGVQSKLGEGSTFYAVIPKYYKSPEQNDLEE